MTNAEQGMTPKQYELKIEALKQSLANKVAQYEDQVANLRVALTETTEQLEEARGELANRQNEVAEAPAE